MFCPKCGKAYPAGAVNCASCGTAVNGGFSDYLTWKLAAVAFLLMASLFLWQQGLLEVSWGPFSYNDNGVPGPELVGPDLAGYAVNAFLIFAALWTVYPLVTKRDISAAALLPAKIAGIGMPVILIISTVFGLNSSEAFELELALTGSAWLLVLTLCAMLVLAFLTTQQIEALEYYYASTPKLETLDGEVVERKRAAAGQPSQDLICLRQRNGNVLKLTLDPADRIDVAVGMRGKFHTEDRRIVQFSPEK